MPKKIKFLNLLRKTKQSDIFYHRSIATLFFFVSKPLIFEKKKLLSRTNLSGGNTNDGRKKIQKNFYLAFDSVL